MKTYAILSLFFFAFLTGYGQIENRTETNCSGESRSVYDVGDSGKPLIVASKGFDCGICQNQASAVKTWADNNADVVEVWGAMTFTYNSSAASCDDVNNWNSTHGWNENIFSFPDQDEFWFDLGTPRYYVIHPETHEVEYMGSSFNTATGIALELTTLSTDDLSETVEFKVWQSQEGVVVELEESLSGELRIFNLLGQQVFNQTLRLNENRMVIPFSENEGIYILSLQTNSGEVTARRFAFRSL